MSRHDMVVRGVRDRVEITLPIVVQASRLPVRGTQAGRLPSRGTQAGRLHHNWQSYFHAVPNSPHHHVVP